LLNVADLEFVIEAAESLAPPVIWTPVQTNLNSGAIYEFIDEDQANFRQRFYRAYLLD
jgi:hypothetical protein